MQKRDRDQGSPEPITMQWQACNFLRATGRQELLESLSMDPFGSLYRFRQGPDGEPELQTVIELAQELQQLDAGSAQAD